jgi:phage shock protein PspC (stress-responsive transcriptional regulator)
MKTVNSTKRIYRNLDKSIISGVCAGVADYLSIDALWVRIAAVVALIFMPMLTLPGYFLAVILLPRKTY